MPRVLQFRNQSETYFIGLTTLNPLELRGKQHFTPPKLRIYTVYPLVASDFIRKFSELILMPIRIIYIDYHVHYVGILAPLIIETRAMLKENENKEEQEINK